MFKYNELSDLVNGSLVTPLSKMDDDSIRCLNSNGEECYHKFEDFDFDKPESERALNSNSLESEAENLLNGETETQEPKKEMTYQDMLDEMEKKDEIIDDSITTEEIDDSIYDGTDEPKDPEPPEVFVRDVEGFCDYNKTTEVLRYIGKEREEGHEYTVWEDIVQQI